jgi:hypothetical protein
MAPATASGVSMRQLWPQRSSASSREPGIRCASSSENRTGVRMSCRPTRTRVEQPMPPARPDVSLARSARL